MTQRETLERIFQKYGETVHIRGNDVKGMLRPLQYKSAASLKLPNDFDCNLNILYTGPIGQKIGVGDEVNTAEHNYTVKRADTALIGGEELYAWAVLGLLAPDADKEVYLEADGKRAASVGSYTEQTSQQSRAIPAWGEQEPVGTAPGRTQYALTLSNVRPAEGISLFALADFKLIAIRAGTRVVYAGCRWKSIASTGGAGNPHNRTMELVAAQRTEEAMKNDGQ